MLTPKKVYQMNTNETNENNETVFEKIPGRRIFSPVDSEGNLPDEFFTAIGNLYDSVPDTIPVILNGFEINESGEFVPDDDIFADDSVAPMIAKVARKTETGKNPDGTAIYQNVTKAVVVSFIPTLDALLAKPEGKKWVADKLATEFAQITMRPVREADDFTSPDIPEAMPKGIDDFLAARKSGGRVDNEAFATFWKKILDALKKHPKVGKAVSNANLRKAMFEKCLRNSAFATAMYGNLETAQIFVTALRVIIANAKKAGLDTSVLENWEATRDAQTYEVESLDLGGLDLMDSFDLGDEADEAAEATGVDE